MDRLREAWRNDVLISMLSSFCVGLGMGVSLLVFFVPRGPWMIAPLGASMTLLWCGIGLLARADRLRYARWERREWR